MTRKIAIYGILAYILYALFFYWYLFYFTDGSLPFEYQGSKADPETFLNERELFLSEEYSRIRNLLFFLNTPFQWLMYLLILLAGLSKVFQRWAENTTNFKFVQGAIYVFWLLILTFIITFPVKYLSYHISKVYHITVQTFPSWMKDQLIDFWLEFGSTFLIVTVLYWLMKKSEKRWWLYAWLLSVPFTLFVMFIQPVLIDPLYNDFYPLKNKELEEKILALAAEAHIPAEHVYEVNMSEKTNALNAYVTGIGSNSRIVLWDTTLNRLNDEEILFIMAHEMAHYVEKHLYYGIAGYLLLSLIGLFVAAKLMKLIVDKWGEALKISRLKDMSSYPLFILILSVLLFLSSPVTNMASRYMEQRADRYAIELTEDTEAGISTFQELTRASLSQVNPPLLVKIFRYGHPTMLERISRLEEFEIKKRNMNNGE